MNSTYRHTCTCWARVRAPASVRSRPVAMPTNSPNSLRAACRPHREYHPSWNSTPAPNHQHGQTTPWNTKRSRVRIWQASCRQMSRTIIIHLNIYYLLCFILTKQLLCSVNIYMWQGYYSYWKPTLKPFKKSLLQKNIKLK